jgi:hypothetical protein
MGASVYSQNLQIVLDAFAKSRKFNRLADIQAAYLANPAAIWQAPARRADRHRHASQNSQLSRIAFAKSRHFSDLPRACGAQ